MSKTMKEMELEVWELDNMNKIHNVDCLEFMRTVPDGYFDLVLTDPPYDISKSDPGKSSIMSLGKFGKNTKLSDISDGFNIELVLGECLRISKKANMFIFCSNKQLSKIMQFGEKRGFYTTCLVWHKNNSAPFANGVWRGDIEFCVHIREKGAYFEGGANLKEKVTKLPANPSEFGHPTEKPLKLIEKYLEIGASKQCKIFDPFMGSGTTAVAAKAKGIDWCGCELEPDYVEIANKRLKAVQMSIFSLDGVE
jgi:DNA modification methylase